MTAQPVVGILNAIGKAWDKGQRSELTGHLSIPLHRFSRVIQRDEHAPMLPQGREQFV